MKRTVQLYLKDIKDAIHKIHSYTKNSFYKDFCEDERTIDAVIRNLEIIGEAAKNIPQDVKNKYSSIPWKDIVAMRNKIIHEYFGVDVEILWQTIQTDLPELKRKLKALESL